MFRDPLRTYLARDGRTLDPLPIRRHLLLQTGGQLNSLLDAAGGDDALAAATAEGGLAAAARVAFGLPAFTDGGGATEADCLAELNAYLDWAAAGE